MYCQHLWALATRPLQMFEAPPNIRTSDCDTLEMLRLRWIVVGVPMKHCYSMATVYQFSHHGPMKPFPPITSTRIISPNYGLAYR